MCQSTTDRYGKYHRYTMLISCWAVIVLTYITLLELAVQGHDLMGAKGSSYRARKFDVLAFFRRGLATIHVPIVVAVLASTVPFWTIARKPWLNEQLTASLASGPKEVEKTTSVPQLFYLADRTWAGLIGWITMVFVDAKVQRPSRTWVHLAVIAALSYVGFPLLSVAYVLNSVQYWESQKILATVSVGGLNSSYAEAIATMQSTGLWMGRGSFDGPADLGSLAMYNSSETSGVPYQGLSSDIPWADNSTLLTLPLFASGNAQLSRVGLQVFASCSFSSYNQTIYLPSYSEGSEPNLAFNFVDVNPQTNSGLPYKLSCKHDCRTSRDSEDVTCSTNTSMLKIWPSGYTSEDGLDEDGIFLGQTLSCVQIQNSSASSVKSVASIQLALQGPGAWTSVASCNMSVSYARPIVNTLIGEFMQSTIAASSLSLLQILDINPSQLFRPKHSIVSQLFS